MSHYPSTAELAAFRRAVPRLAPFPSAPVHRNGNDGAYSWQRTGGIGYLETAPDAMCIVIPDGAVHTGVIARRRAGVLRSRAYAAAACPVCRVADFPDGPGCDCYGA